MNTLSKLYNWISGSALDIRSARDQLDPNDKNGADKLLSSVPVEKLFQLPEAPSYPYHDLHPDAIYLHAWKKGQIPAILHMLRRANMDQFIAALILVSENRGKAAYAQQIAAVQEYLASMTLDGQIAVLQNLSNHERLDIITDLSSNGRVFSDAAIIAVLEGYAKAYFRQDNLVKFAANVHRGLLLAIEAKINPYMIAQIIESTTDEREFYHATIHGETIFMMANGSYVDTILSRTTNQENIHKPDNLGFTALHRAIIAKDYQKAAKICWATKNTRDLVRHSKDGHTPYSLITPYPGFNPEGPDRRNQLHHAAITRNEVDAKFLVYVAASVGDIHRTDRYGCTPLMLAAYSKSPVIAGFILNVTASENDIYLQDENKTTALHFALDQKDLETARLILNRTKNEDNLYKQAYNGSTALSLAAACGDTKIIADILKKTRNLSNLRLVCKHGLTALQWAEKSGHKQIAAMIREKERRLSNPQNDLPAPATSNQNNVAAKPPEPAKILSINPFLHAVESQNAVTLAKLLAIDPEAVKRRIGPKGQTLLIYALEQKSPACAKILIKHSASTKPEDNNNASPVLTAAMYGIAEILPELIQSNSDLEIINSDNDTPLLLSAYYGHSAMVQELLQRGANLKHINKNGLTALDIAIAEREWPCVKALLEKDAPLGKPETSLPSLLVLAAQHGDTRLAERLIENGTDIESKDQYGSTALNRAAENGRHEIVDMLLRRKANVNAVTNSGWTPLMHAAHNGQTEIVENFLKARANVQLRLKDGWTALMLAASKGHLKIVNRLIDADTNLEYSTKYGSTAFMIAAANDHLDVLQALAAAKANIHATTPNNKSAIHLAAYNGSVNCMQQLLDMDFDIEFKDNSGCTPLMEAARGNKPHMVEYLIKNGANVFAKCYKDRTPIMYAVKGKSKACVDILYEYRADMNVVDYKGETPQSLAVKAGVPEIAVDWAIDGKIPVKDTINIFGLVYQENALYPNQAINMPEYRQRLNNALFIAVHEKDIRTICVALNSGADPLAPCFMGSISPLGLAVHMDDPAVLRLIVKHMQKNMPAEKIEQAKHESQKSVRAYYAAMGASVANSCTTRKKDRVDLAAATAQRLEKGRFIGAELRKFLYQKTKDKKFVTHYDAFDLELQLDASLVENIGSGKARLSFPALNYALIGEQEVWQIFQELIIMNMLQQRISLGLPQDPVFNTGIYVELTESLHDTLVGTVVTETDRIMKEYTTNSIYLPPEARKKFDWRNELQTTDTDWPKLDSDDTANIAKVEQIYLAHGGVDLSKLDGVEPLTYQALVEAEYTVNGIINVPAAAICLDNVGASLTYSGNSICAHDQVNIFEWGRWQLKNEEEVKPYRTKNWDSTTHLVNTLRRIPLFAKQFALLEAVYTLAPVAQAMVMSGNIPDFKKLPKMRPYETEKTQPPIIVRRPNTLIDHFRTPAEMRRALEQAHESGDYENVYYSVFGGCVHNYGFTSQELSSKDFKKEKARLAAESQARRGGGNGDGGNGGNGDGSNGNGGGDGPDPEKLIQQIIEGKRIQLQQEKLRAEKTKEQAQETHKELLESEARIRANGETRRAAQELARAEETKALIIEQSARIALAEKHLAALQDEARIRAAWERSQAITDLEKARKAQEKPPYGKIDDHRLEFVPKGTIILGNATEHGPSPFFSDIDTLFHSHGDAERYFKHVQTAESKKEGYRPQVSIYVVKEDMFIPTAICEKNSHVSDGAGGGKQFYLARYPEVLIARKNSTPISLLKNQNNREK
ncbi:MAG: hypothetical protein EYC62_01015 [Alphaproteobacteria bacterium]|nr:MAG: hypothetical protein EYC62_01015 [Alphaproteobacteria bacterium]